MTTEPEPLREEEEPLDSIATFLFLIFGGALAYLILARSYGIYPWMIFIDVIIFIQTWEAVFTFLAILCLMFASLIAGMIRMRYSKILVGIIVIIAVFFVTFYTMYMVGTMIMMPGS